MVADGADCGSDRQPVARSQRTRGSGYQDQCGERHSVRAHALGPPLVPAWLVSRHLRPPGPPSRKRPDGVNAYATNRPWRRPFIKSALVTRHRGAKLDSEPEGYLLPVDMTNGRNSRMTLGRSRPVVSCQDRTSSVAGEQCE